MRWSATLTDNDFRQLEFEGKLNKTLIAKSVGFSKSALVQNPRIRKLLEELEQRLRDDGVLPQLTEKGIAAKATPKKHDKTLSKQREDAKRIAELEHQVLTFKMKLERFQELSEVMNELGLEDER